MAKEFKRKIVLIGDPAVGKTSPIQRFVKDEYDDKYIQTIGAKVTKKEMVFAVREAPVQMTLTIWDVVGAQGYQGVQARSFAGSNGALVVCDLTRRETLESLEKYWIPLLHKVVQKVPFVFLGNKSDLPRAFAEEELLAVALKHPPEGGELPRGFSVAYLTSAKTGDNVQKAFATLCHLMAVQPILEEEVKQHLETLVAIGLSQEADLTTARGVTDAIINDVANGFPDLESAFVIVRAEFARAGMDSANPTLEQLRRAVHCLADGERVFLGESAVERNLQRRMQLLDAFQAKQAP